MTTTRAAARILDQLEAAGLTLAYSPDTGRLNVKPTAKLTPELTAVVKEHKEGIVSALHETQASKVSNTPGGTVPARGDEKSPTHETPASKTSNTPTDLSAFAKRKLEDADELGLAAVWSRHFGYVSLHDPTTGEWHDLRTKDAPDWATEEARWRKGGGAYRLRVGAYRLPFA